MPVETHAKLPPSAAHRWLICTPSAMLEMAEPSVYSPYAEEGTHAHELAELRLSFMLGKISQGEYDARFNEFKSRSKWYNEEFNEYVNSYCNEVMTIVNTDYKGIETKVYLEEKVYFDDIYPDGSGTSDCVIVGPNFIHIVDLKFGKGVAVSAIDNPQLKLYALGAVKKHIRECSCSEVRMTIIQPRLDEKSTDYLSIGNLNHWALTVVKPQAELAIAGKGERVPGDHCKFCKLKGKCEKLASRQLELAQAEFEGTIDKTTNEILKPENMSPETLSRILTIAPAFNDWLKDVQSYATMAAITQGLKIPGFKIVEGRSVRMITDPKAVIEKLQELGFAKETYLKPPELLGISYLERNVGKKLFNSVCEEYIVKPQGKPTLVPDSDKRTALDDKVLRLDGSEFEWNIGQEEN